MTTLRHRRLFAAATLAGVLLLGASAGAAPRSDTAGPTAARSLAGDLDRARLDSEAAQTALAALKRISEPGHLLDPLPPQLLAGVADLQAQYAELERKAAGYRATLGAQHPTLRGAEEMMADLRRQILDGVRRVLGPAEQDAARARATVAALERRIQAADATASIARPPAPAAEPQTAIAREAEALPASASPEPSSAESDPVEALSLGAIGLFGLAFVAGATLRHRRRSARALKRRDPGLVVAPKQDMAPLPVVGQLALREGDDAATVRARLASGEDPHLAAEAAALFATLAAAAEAEPVDQLSVAVTSHAPAGEPGATALALALAFAAADTGRRVLLVDGTGDDRLAPALGGDAVAAVVTIGATTRGMIRVAIGARAVVLLAGATPVGTRTVPRLADLDGFDTIVTAGAEAGPLAARFALVTAPAGADTTTLAAAARTGGASERPCGAVLLARAPDVALEDAHRAAPPSPRRRLGAEATSVRLGLRRTLDPVRRRA